MSGQRILYDTEGAAEMLSTSTRHIHELRRAGKLEAVQEGRVKKFRHEELVRFANSLEAAS